MSLFNKLSGVTGENISTEIVGHLLSSKDRYSPFQRLFFNRVLGAAKNSIQLDTETQTQVTFEVGRPDLIILSREFIIILENKLGAYLSGDDQLIAYCRAFTDENYLKGNFPLIDIDLVRKKFLVFLAPQKTIGLSISASDAACREENGVGFKEFREQNDITFVPLPWEELIEYLDLADSVQNELYLFVKEYINQELSREEKMVLQNPQIPAALTKVFNYIDELRNEVVAQGWKVSRITQSYIYYGFYIEPEKIQYLYFGYFFKLWESFKTPIFLQIDEGGVKKIGINGIEKTLADNQFVPDKALNFVRPFRIDAIETWKPELINILQGLIGPKTGAKA